MSLVSWFNSSAQVDAALVYVAVVGAVVELGVAIAAVINVHKEISESRKEQLERYIEIFACVAAFFFLAEAILGCRSSMLLGKEIEKFKGDNLVLTTNVTSLEIAVIQLAHQYDLSTNALAEARARLADTEFELLSVSNAAAMNSPSNFPISSVSGLGDIVVKNAPIVVGLKGKRANLWLMSSNGMYSGFIIVEGRIETIMTNRPEVMAVVVHFDKPNIIQFGNPRLTFNNLSIARLFLFPDGPWSEAESVEVYGGRLNLELDSRFEFESDFVFAHQTNDESGILGVREKRPF